MFCLTVCVYAFRVLFHFFFFLFFFFCFVFFFFFCFVLLFDMHAYIYVSVLYICTSLLIRGKKLYALQKVISLLLVHETITFILLRARRN